MYAKAGGRQEKDLRTGLQACVHMYVLPGQSEKFPDKSRFMKSCHAHL